MFAFVLFYLVLSTKPKDWLGRTSPKWPNLCWVGPNQFLWNTAYFTWAVIFC